RATVRRAVEAVDQVARLLELDGEEVGGGRVYAHHLAAGGVRAARLDLVRPEGAPRLVRLATEEVNVVLSDEVLRVVNGVRDVAVDHQHVGEFEVVNGAAQVRLRVGQLALRGVGVGGGGEVERARQRGFDAGNRRVAGALRAELRVSLLDVRDDGRDAVGEAYVLRGGRACRRIRRDRRGEFVAEVLRVPARLVNAGLRVTGSRSWSRLRRRRGR